MVIDFCITREKLTIRGKIFVEEVQTPSPAVIISHEFGLNMKSVLRYARPLHQQGYVVVVYDFCGSGFGASDGESTNMSVLTEKEDLSAVLDYVKKLDYVDEKRVILMGCSQGGLVSALVAAEREEEVEKLILLYPAFCIPDQARQFAKFWFKLGMKNLPKMFTIWHIKLGKRYFEDAMSLEPWKEICNYAKPVLIVHGDMDWMAPVRYSKIAQEKYTNCQLVRIRWAQHMFFTTAFKRAIKEVVRYVERKDGHKVNEKRAN